MDENVPLTVRQDASDGYRLLPCPPAREPRDLTVCLRMPFKDRQPMISLWGEGRVLPRSRTREHWAVLETDVDDIKDLAAQLLADWKAFVDFQPVDPASGRPRGGVRPYAAEADLSTRPPGEVRSRVAELARDGKHLLEELLAGNHPNLIRLRAFLIDALERRDLRIRFDSDLALPWPMLAVGASPPPISGPAATVPSTPPGAQAPPTSNGPPAPYPPGSPRPPGDPHLPGDPHTAPGPQGVPGGSPQDGPHVPGNLLDPSHLSDLSHLFDLFLGHRHFIESASGAYETDYYYVSSRPRPVSSANVDHTLRGVPRAAEVTKLLDDQTELTERTHSDVLLADLAMAHFDEDLMYFFCHGSVLREGDSTWQVLKLTDPRTVHAARIDHIRRGHTEANRSRGAFVPFHPMVLLNVCYAGAPATGRFEDLAGSFIRHGAQGVLAPHIAVPKVFGVEFALRFLTAYLVDRVAAGTAVRETVRWFAAEYHNPLGLVYGLQCGLDSRLAPRAPHRGAAP